MAAILAAVLEALGLTSTVLSIVQSIQSLLGPVAVEHQKYAIETIASNAANTVNSPTFGNAQLKADIAALKLDLDASVASLTLQIVGLTDGTTPVSLPVPAPAGFFAGSSGEIGSAVWDTHIPPFGDLASAYIQAAGQWGASRINLGWLGDENRYFAAVWANIDWVAGASDDPPVFDPTDILSTEDVLTCLTRQNPTFTCTWAFDTGGFVRLIGSFGADVEEWQSTIDNAQFQQIKALLFPTALVDVAPVWPGLANVTLGTPVSLALGVTITTPMDGVLVEITSVPAKQGSFAFDAISSWRNVGALAFGSDNGDYEFPQTLGFTSAVYTPKQLLHAASVAVRTTIGVAGTITPWTVTP